MGVKAKVSYSVADTSSNFGVGADPAHNDTWMKALKKAAEDRLTTKGWTATVTPKVASGGAAVEFELDVTALQATAAKAALKKP